jgi:hypothetical protein
VPEHPEGADTCYKISFGMHLESQLFRAFSIKSTWANALIDLDLPNEERDSLSGALRRIQIEVHRPGEFCRILALVRPSEFRRFIGELEQHPNC